MKVSACIITYNHEEYITKTIEGALAQKMVYEYEIIISDDCSSDGTRDICRSYQERYPDKIKLILPERNLGMSGNWLKAISGCSGKYIAICEGDDFWTDPYKLQTQVEFLEKNPEFAICFHNSRIIYEEDAEMESYSNLPTQVEVTTFEDLAEGEYIYTATGVFRKNDFQKFPISFYKYLNNYTVDLHNAQFGKIKYLNSVMSVYRVHKGGVWSMVPRDQVLINQLPTYKFYLDYFDKKYRKYFLAHLSKMTAELIAIKASKREFKNIWKYYKDFVYYNITNRREIKNIGFYLLKVPYNVLEKLIKGK